MPPQADEYEITLFGPGFGEAIAVHLGDQRWLLIDSCIDPNVKKPASGHYLESIGVNPDGIKSIVASHWHDDHVRGFSALTAQYPNAEIFIPSVFSKAEVLQFLAAYGGEPCEKLAKGTRELYDVIKRRKWIPTSQRMPIFDGETLGQKVLACALTPLPAAFAKFVAYAAQLIPAAGKPINDAPELRPNAESIVVHLQFGEEALLLGSDLEEHATHGWSAVTADAWSQKRRKANVYKVAHHGSQGAHHDDIYSVLLTVKPISLLTPFYNGRHKLPNESDRQRIRALSAKTFITSKVGATPTLPATQVKRLRNVVKNLAPVNPGFGAIRLRRKYNNAEWQVELFGDAGAI